jgi:hypothetical protein
MSRLDLLKYIQEIKKLSYQELKYLKEATTDKDKLKVLDLEISRRLYASS